MYSIRFEWNEKKNRENQRKHGVSFEEAQTVFLDENAIEYFDLDHSGHEDRFILLGVSARLRVAVVCYCHRQGNVIRLISARKADNREEKDYWETFK